MHLRYGMNPHQSARVVDDGPFTVRAGTPSLINLLDAAAGWQLVKEAASVTGQVAAASIKHLSPAGVALPGPLDEAAQEAWGVDPAIGAAATAYVRARDADPKSSFGDLVAFSAPVDLDAAQLLAKVVSDGVVAPGYEPGALAVLARKKGGAFLVLEADARHRAPQWERRDIAGAVVEQQRDEGEITAGLVGERATRPDDALLGLVTARYCQSNAVALVRDGATVGIGVGQQNRVDCVRLAIAKSATWWLRRHPRVRGLPRVDGMTRQERLNWQIRLAEADMTSRQAAEFGRLFGGAPARLPDADRAAWLQGRAGLTLVSDAFLPFRDSVDHAAAAGVTHVVEPGGSSRSAEVAEACAEHGITLSRTGLRLFRH